MDQLLYLQGNWHQLKGKIKKNWGKLTDDELDKMSGREEEILGALQKYYGITEEQARADLHKFLSSGP